MLKRHSWNLCCLTLDLAYLKGLTGLDDSYLRPLLMQTALLAEDNKSNTQHDLQEAHTNQLVKLITFIQSLKDISHHSWHSSLKNLHYHQQPLWYNLIEPRISL